MKAEELHRFITAMNTKINDIIGQETGGVHLRVLNFLIAFNLLLSMDTLFIIKDSSMKHKKEAECSLQEIK